MQSLAIYTQVQTCFDWVLRATWQASVLICLILLVQWTLRHRLNVRVRYLVWLVVLIRLAMPWMPQSRLSMYNLLPDSLRQLNHKTLMNPLYASVTDESSAPPMIKRHVSPMGSTSTGMIHRADASTRHGPMRRILHLLPLFWLAGTCLLGMYILVGDIRIRRMIRGARAVTHPDILDLLADCQKQMGTRSPVRMIVTDRIGSPAMFGLLKPCLLLPCRTVSEMNRRELRYIFLHELAHLKNNDILISMIASTLHILHWFNPLIAYSFKRMHADRELACDGKVLSLLHPREAAAYGDTIISQIELLLTSHSRPALTMGFIGAQTQIRQRIAMISLFQKETYRWSPLALGLIGCLACVGLTNGCKTDQGHDTVHHALEPAIKVESADSSGLAKTPPVLSQNTNTKRIYIRHMETGKYLVSNGDNVTCDADKPGEAGLWEAHYDGEFTPDGNMTLFSVSSGKYLSTSDQGDLAVDQRGSNPRALWIRQAGPLGVQVISETFKHGYLRLDEQGQVEAVQMGRDHLAYWDIVQLD